MTFQKKVPTKKKAEVLAQKAERAKANARESVRLLLPLNDTSLSAVETHKTSKPKPTKKRAPRGAEAPRKAKIVRLVGASRCAGYPCGPSTPCAKVKSRIKELILLTLRKLLDLEIALLNLKHDILNPESYELNSK